MRNPATARSTDLEYMLATTVHALQHQEVAEALGQAVQFEERCFAVRSFALVVVT